MSFSLTFLSDPSKEHSIGCSFEEEKESLEMHRKGTEGRLTYQLILDNFHSGDDMFFETEKRVKPLCGTMVLN